MAVEVGNIIAAPISAGAPPLDSRHPLNFDALPTSMSVFMPSGDDDTAVLQTLYRMEEISRRTHCDPRVAGAAQDAIADLPSNADRKAKAAAIWSYVKSLVRFVQDAELYPGAREVLITPPRLLTMPQPTGDCDDFTMLVAAMCAAAGVPARVVAVAADPAQSSRFTHVYCEAILEDGSTLPLDASHGPHPGWEAPRVSKRLPWKIIAPGSCYLPDDYGGPRLLACLIFAAALVLAAIALGQIGSRK